MKMTDELTTLIDYLADAGQPTSFVDIADTKFAINNDDEAFWAMRRLAIAQRRIDEVKRQAQIELDRINRWVAENSASAEREISYFDKVLGNYLVRVRENDTDGRKKLDFPDGTITSRVTPDKVTVEDADAFLAWAEANGHADWVRVKREADVATIKKVVDFSDGAVIDPMTGQIVAGLSRVEGGVSVTVKVNE
jgi:phage host-nuclease inhibitor protein Gam